MKKVRFLTLAFQHYDENAPSLARYIRLRASGMIFYADRHRFSGSSLLNKLRNGDTIHVGALTMSDGSYCLCWLHCPEKGTLKPIAYGDEKRFTAAQEPFELKTKLWVIFSVFCAVVGVYYWPFLTVAIPAFFIGRLIFGRLHRSIVKDDTLDREIKQGFESAIAGELSCFQVQKEEHIGSNALDAPIVEDASLAICRGRVSGVFHDYYRIRSFAPNRLPSYFIRTTFTLQERVFSITSSTSDLASVSSAMPDFRDSPSMFLAEGDEVSVVYQCGNDGVFGLFNEEDCCARGRRERWGASLTDIYVIGFILGFAMMVIIGMLTLMEVFDWWQGEFYPGWREWSDLLRMQGFVVLSTMGLLILGGIYLKVMTFFDLRFSDISRRTNSARAILRSFRKKNGKSEVIQDFIQ